jgi:hypothetical protein
MFSDDFQPRTGRMLAVLIKNQMFMIPTVISKQLVDKFLQNQLNSLPFLIYFGIFIYFMKYLIKFRQPWTPNSQSRVDFG